MIYTSCFTKIYDLEDRFDKFISISGDCPEFFKMLMKDFPNKFMEYRKLAPKRIWWNEWKEKKLGKDWYTNKYKETVLDKLNADIVFRELNGGTENIVLLCWESRGRFCHRHIVARWLEENVSTKIKIREI